MIFYFLLSENSLKQNSRDDPKGIPHQNLFVCLHRILYQYRIFQMRQSILNNQNFLPSCQIYSRFSMPHIMLYLHVCHPLQRFPQVCLYQDYSSLLFCLLSISSRLICGSNSKGVNGLGTKVATLIDTEGAPFGRSEIE